jgi:hypothetical protein
MLDCSFLAKQGCEPTDLLPKRGANMLGRVLGEVSDAGYNSSENDFLLELA